MASTTHPRRRTPLSRPGRHPEAARPWWTSHWLLVGLVGAVAAVVALIILVGQTATITSSATSPATHGSAAPQSVVAAATTPDVAALAAVGAPSGSAPFVGLPAGTAALTADAHPLVVYVGADYCPFCAARRWSLVVALSRFGTFSNLGLTASSSSDIYPGTSSFSFHGTTFASSWLSFRGVELQTADRQPLDTPDAMVADALTRFDVPPYTSQADAIPFLDIGGRYVSIGAGFSPALLQGMTAEQIAGVIRDPHSRVGAAIMADANAITAAVCSVTGEQPASVCGTASMAQIIGALPGR